MSAASRSSLPSSRARLSRITSEDAVKKRASSLLSHASVQRADAMCVLPVPDLCQDFGHGIERNHAATGIASGLGSGRSKKAGLGSVRSKKSAMASAGTL